MAIRAGRKPTPQGPLDRPLASPDDPPGDLHEAAAREADADGAHAYGELGPRIDRHSPFWLGMAATFGVALSAVVLWALYDIRQVLLLLGVSLFVAAGLDPVVEFIHRRGVPRWAAALLVILAGVALFGGILDLIVPTVVDQVTQLVNQLPHYAKELNSRSSFLGRVNSQYHVEQNLQKYLTTGSSSIATGVLGVGKAVLGAVTSTIIVVVVSIYLLFDLPRVKRTAFSLAPRSRRARVVLLGNEIFAKVGGYVLGNLVISLITGVGTWVWCLALGVPYPLLLAIVVALLDLLPVVGSTIGGIIVSLVALTVSIPVAAATAVFYVVYRGLEDYLLSPRIMQRTVQVPGLVTVIATLLGGALLGVIGALIAIPIAAAIKLLVEEVAIPRLDRS